MTTRRKQESGDETPVAGEQSALQGQNELRDRIAATERLLALYDSPFPDALERAKRAELIAQINELNRQLEEGKSNQ